MTDPISNKPQPIFVISIALHMSIVIYVAVVFFLANQPGWDPGWRIREGNDVLLLALLVPTVMTGVLSFVFPRFARRSDGTAEAIPLFYDFSKTDPKIVSMTIVRMALAESIAIFGLVLSFINQSRLIVVPFAVVALIIQFLVGPIYGKMRTTDNPYT